MLNKKPVLSKTSEMKIGRVTYIVNSHYKADGRETADEKYLRYITNRVTDEVKKPVNAVN
jgi:hypothetical protein